MLNTLIYVLSVVINVLEKVPANNAYCNVNNEPINRRRISNNLTQHINITPRFCRHNPS